MAESSKRPKAEAPAAEETILRLAAAPENLETVQGLIEARLEAVDCPAKIMMAVLTMAEEAFLNIVKHAYRGGGGEATLICRAEPGRVSLEFRDSGPPFNPVEHHDPRPDQPLDEREAGGLGLVLMRKMSDAMTYRREGGENLLTLLKNW